MKQNMRTVLWFLGWLFLLQLASELLGLGVLAFFCDWFGDGGELRAYGLAMLPLWAVWGWFTPKAARSGLKRAVGTLALWTALLGMLTVLLSDYRMLFAMPQQMAGVGLARLLPGPLRLRPLFQRGRAHLYCCHPCTAARPAGFWAVCRPAKSKC